MFGDVGVFAFYPNKQITTGEGGVIVTDRDEWAEAMRSLRNQGRAPGDTWLQHTHLGYNYRMDEMSAALGVAQMERLDELLDRRQRVAGWYEERLSEQAGVSTLSISAATRPGSTARPSPAVSKRSASQAAPTSLRSTCSPTSSSASGTSREISPLPRTSAGAAWPCPFPVSCRRPRSRPSAGGCARRWPARTNRPGNAPKGESA